MNTISYDPSEDELLLSFTPTEGEPTKESGSLKIWWDGEGNIRALAITQYTEESREFRKNLNTTQLGGTWRGVKITAEDIQKNREGLLKKIEEKW
jgi:hypothetical protein